MSTHRPRRIGTPEQITETILGIKAQGTHQFTIHFTDSPRPEGTNLFAERVLPHLSE